MAEEQPLKKREEAKPLEEVEEAPGVPPAPIEGEEKEKVETPLTPEEEGGRDTPESPPATTDKLKKKSPPLSPIPGIHLTLKGIVKKLELDVLNTAQELWDPKDKTGTERLTEFQEAVKELRDAVTKGEQLTPEELKDRLRGINSLLLPLSAPGVELDEETERAIQETLENQGFEAANKMLLDLSVPGTAANQEIIQSVYQALAKAGKNLMRVEKEGRSARVLAPKPDKDLRALRQHRDLRPQGVDITPQADKAVEEEAAISPSALELEEIIGIVAEQVIVPAQEFGKKVTAFSKAVEGVNHSLEEGLSGSSLEEGPTFDKVEAQFGDLRQMLKGISALPKSEVTQARIALTQAEIALMILTEREELKQDPSVREHRDYVDAPLQDLVKNWVRGVNDREIYEAAKEIVKRKRKIQKRVAKPRRASQ